MNTKRQPTSGSRLRIPHSAFRTGFTLIELLIVIAIISILAALIFPITKAVNKRKVLSRGRAELFEMETYINNYKEKLGHYPPDNSKPGLTFVNQLYYELAGTTNNNNVDYITLDGAQRITPADLTALFGASGLVNANNPGSGGDEAQRAIGFLKELKQAKFLAVAAQPPYNTLPFTALGTMLDGPFTFVAADGTGAKLNPWHYNSSHPTNNPTSFDLWVDVSVGTTIYRIGNWSKDPVTIPQPPVYVPN